MSEESLCIAEPLDVSRDRVTHESEHLPDRERHAHSAQPIRVACNEPPQVTECDDRLTASRQSIN